MDTGESGHLHKVDTYIGNRWFPAEFLTSKSLLSNNYKAVILKADTLFWHKKIFSFEINLSKEDNSGNH